MAKKHLIVGGLGFLGSELVNRLRSQAPADEIHVVDLNWFSAPVPAWIRFHPKNAWELSAADLAGFSSVTMLSAIANDQVVASEPRANFRDNLALPSYLAWTAREAGVKKFIFSSTTSLYESEGEELWTETMCVQPQSAPSVVKWQVERALESWTRDSFETFSFRLGTLGGWSARPRLDLVINTMCKAAVKDSRIRVMGPAVWRSTISVGNTAEAMAEACLGTRLSPGIYNLVEGAYTLLELAEAVKSAAGEAGLNVELEILESATRRNFRADSGKIRRSLPDLHWQSPRAIAVSVLAPLRKMSPQELDGTAFSNHAVYLAGVRDGME